MKYNLFSTTVIYSGLTFLQPFTSFLLLPLYLGYFSPEEYGIFSLMNGVTVFFSLIGGFGVASAVVGYYYLYKDDPEKLDRYVGNLLSFTLLFNGAVFLLFLFCGPLLFGALFRSGSLSFYPYGFLGLLTGLLATVSFPYLNVLRNKGEAKAFALITIATVAVSVGFQLLFVMGMGLGVTGALTARLLGALVGAGIAVAVNLRFLTLKPEKDYISGSLRFSLGSLPSTLLIWGYSYIDRFLVERFLSLASLGIVSLLFTIASLIEMAYWAVSRAVQPVLFEAFSDKEGDNREKINRYARFYLHCTLLFASGILLVGSNLHVITSKPEYLSIVEYLPLLCFGFFLAAYQNFFGLHFFYARESKHLVTLAGATLALVAGLNVALIPAYGIAGTVAAAITTRFLMIFPSYYLAQRTYPVSYRFQGVFVTPVLIALCMNGLVAALGVFGIDAGIAAVLQFACVCLFMGWMYKEKLVSFFVTARLPES